MTNEIEQVAIAMNECPQMGSIMAKTAYNKTIELLIEKAEKHLDEALKLNCDEDSYAYEKTYLIAWLKQQIIEQDGVMSGPYCKTCDYFSPSALNDFNGECGDPSKIIYVGGGDRLNECPEVHKQCECSNHTGLTPNRE